MLPDVVVTVTFTSSTASSPSPSSSPTPARVIALAPDARKPARVVRADGSSDIGHRTWLALTSDACARISRTAHDVIAVRVNDVEFRAAPLAPALPARAHADEIVQRQCGSLRARGVCVQLRFGRYDAESDTYAVMDGAVTIDATHPAMEALAAALGEIAEEGARAMWARAASVGKNPDVWLPRELSKDDKGYVAGARVREYDWRGKERQERALAKLKDDFGAYVPTRSEAAPMGEKMAERDRFAAALAAKLEILRGVRDGLASDCDAVQMPRVVCGDTIRQLYETCVITNSHTGERVGVRECGVYLDDIEGCNIDEIDVVIERTRQELDVTQHVLRSMFDDVRERIEWDNIESGVETRDVLENGIRRKHMEKLLGREATKADVEASMKIPAKVRAKLVGGCDVEASRRTGKYITDVAARGRLAES